MFRTFRSAHSLGAVLSALLIATTISTALGQTVDFMAPPRTIADITSILDQEKPNSEVFSKNRAAANLQPPRGASTAALHKFYLERGRARAELGRLADAHSDAERAIKLGQGSVGFGELFTARLFVVLLHLNAGEFKVARDLLSSVERDVQNAPPAQNRGRLHVVYRWTISALVARGDLAQAEGYLRRLQALFAEARSWNAFNLFGRAYESEVERAKATIADARGNFRDAEIAYSRAIALVKGLIPLLPTFPEGSRIVTKEQLENRIDVELSLRGRTKANQGRLAEAEVDARTSLISRLKAQGKYNVTSANVIEHLAFIISLQGRHAEAERLMSATLDIRRTIGVAPDSEAIVGNLRRLASLATLQGRYKDASKLDTEIDQIIERWPPERRQPFELDSNRVYSLLATGRIEDGVAAAQKQLTRETTRLGEAHIDVALMRGLLAIGYAKAQRVSDAIREFGNSVPRLIGAPRAADVDDSAVVALRNALMRDVVESYVDLLIRSSSAESPSAAEEALRLIDAARGRSVQQAVTASAARMMAADKAPAELIRRSQDQEKQIAALLALVSNVLASPPEARDDNVVRRLNADIEALRTARASTRAEIVRRIPNYAELTDPKPPTVADLRTVLRPTEAFLSFYFGREKSFVFALPKEGPVAAAIIPANRADVDAMIAQLRRALEQDSDPVQDFDLQLASDLYELLLKPVEVGWKGAKSLIFATNGSLGLLPLALLPRERTTLDRDSAPAFSGYRKVPWLARTHVTVQVPSAAAFRTLRQLPPGSSSREPLIGFGDPFFSEKQASDAASEITRVASMTTAETSTTVRRRALVRTTEVDSAGLASLPRLPDTADELIAVAQAMQVDPTRTLHLGKAANERAVKRADLARYRTVAFATHGLMPGDLNGLTQPALALTAPSVAGIDGDGLLSMDEVLALKLDADLVVLSACNTGSGSSAGAEALSGLGRAFFYAGSRALLITNWSVDSISARELVSDLFKRLASNPSLGSGEALRQSMMELVDSGYYVKDGKPVHSYGHPMYWAPYTLVGDAGAK